MHDQMLLQLMEDDIAPAHQLLELLKAESLALHGRDMLLLENILAQKQSLIVELEQQGKNWKQEWYARGEHVTVDARPFLRGR